MVAANSSKTSARIYDKHVREDDCLHPLAPLLGTV